LTHNNSIKTAILIAREKPDRDHDLSALLLNKNISLIRVESGTEALSVFRTNPAIALAIINADLSLLNGYETSLKIRKLSPTIPIILFVNYVNTDSIRLSIPCSPLTA
jgi:CheY-like chemotaxis protein